MPEIVKILVVEDDRDQLQTYHDSADDLSNDDHKLELVPIQSADEAINELLSKDFDGAIVDLNLDRSSPAEASGNTVLRDITGKHRFPVAVVSGNLQNLESDIKLSGFLKAIERDTPNDEIFDYLLNIYSTGITKILGGRGQIEEHLGDIFWKHLACEFGDWDAGRRDSEKTLLRYTVTHLAEYLDIPDGSGNAYYHDAEFYIIPPIREHISTGDIVKRDNNRYIVLSPACDIAVRSVEGGRPIINANNIVLAPLILVDRSEFISHRIILEGDNSDERKKKLDAIIKGNREKYAFLPESGSINSSVVDFQNLCAWTLDEFLQSERLATVADSFLKNIQSQFSAYYGRQGQPDLDKSDLLRKNKGKLSPPS